jgi:hypothetical protein
MTVQHDQYFSYTNKPAQTAPCIICKTPTHDFIAYTPPGIVALERGCCRGCVNEAHDTLREIADGMAALGRTINRFKRLFGKS